MKNYKNKNNKGFTLSEILVTLGIIGVVSAITIPTLMNKTNDAELKVGAKKAYSAMQNAYNLAIAENGRGFGGYNERNNSYEKFNAIKSQMKVIKECPFNTGSFGNCWASEGVGDPDATPTTCQGFIVSFQDRNTSFITTDGTAFMLYTYTESTGIDSVAVDINGPEKPNEWGKDAFVIRLLDTKIKMDSGSCTYPNKDGSVITNFNYLLE